MNAPAKPHTHGPHYWFDEGSPVPLHARVLAALYGGGAFLLAAKVRGEIRAKPALLASTLAELKKDAECVRNARTTHD